MTDGQRLIVEMIDAHQEAIAVFARKSYSSHGRGCVFVEFPYVAPGETVLGVIDLEYRRTDDVPLINDDAAILRGQIESYDPDRQAVVLGAIDGELPVSMKMRLERRVLVPGPREAQ